MYVPGSGVSEIHKKTPWIKIPVSFKDIGYHSALICWIYSLSSTYGIEVYPTIARRTSLLKSLVEPFQGFKYIFTLKPDILLISPFGSYLFSIIPLILAYKIYTRITKSKKTKFVLTMGYKGCEYEVILLASFETMKHFSHIQIEYHLGAKSL